MTPLNAVLRPSVMRDHAVHERASTPLELLFDLSFVVAVAVLAAELHHGISEGHALSAAATYLAVFVPIWWAWMSFTWYATAFSHDDALTRVLTLVQMAGVLAVAATIPAAVEGHMGAFTLAYTLMRLPLIVQWLRSARDDATHRGFALTYATGSVVAQLVWITGLAADGAARWAVYVVALTVELLTPVLAVRRSPDRVFHPGHIAERYGLFTLIVLGETLLAVTVGLRDAVEGATSTPAAVVLTGPVLVIAFALWWLYFDALGREGLQRNRKAAFVWGYGHYLLFAAIAAIGAGAQAQLDALAAHAPGASSEVHGPGPAVAVAAVGLPLSVVLLVVAWLQHAANHRTGSAAPLLLGAAAAAALTAAGGALGAPTANALLALVVVAEVVAFQVFHGRDAAGA
ncbi:MAG: low temperature requirement protein A [Kineosporiaceae bacterium]|nr:low temperature requirement protein A [Kineosporiaceae bacterium]